MKNIVEKYSTILEVELSRGDLHKYSCERTVELSVAASKVCYLQYNDPLASCWTRGSVKVH